MSMQSQRHHVWPAESPFHVHEGVWQATPLAGPHINSEPPTLAASTLGIVDVVASQQPLVPLYLGQHTMGHGAWGTCDPVHA